MRKKKSDNTGRPPAFQIYVKDWLTSKKRAVMDLDQQGAYINLLCHCWDTDDCSLPDNDQALAKLSELREQWNDRSTPVRECFTKHPLSEGRLTNVRLYEEHIKRMEFIRDASNAGRASGLSRRNNKEKHSERPFNDRSTTVERTLERNVNEKGTLQSSVFSLQSSSLSSPVLQKEPTKKEKKRRDLESFELTDELRQWATSEFSVSIPDDVFQEFKDHWLKEPDTKLRINWTATFKTRIRQLVNWKTLVPKQQGLVETCMFQEQQVQKNSRLPTYKPCGKPLAENTKKKLCADHIRAEQERLSRKPVLPLLREDTTL